MAAAEADGVAHQADAARRRRLRWRARRGLLENDLLLTRFLDRYEGRLSDGEVAGLDFLLDLPDNELLDLILMRTELGARTTGGDRHADPAGAAPAADPGIVAQAAKVLELLRLPAVAG